MTKQPVFLFLNPAAGVSVVILGIGLWFVASWLDRFNGREAVVSRPHVMARGRNNRSENLRF